jgi:Bacteriophage T4-like portal protein (Gp20)
MNDDGAVTVAGAGYYGTYVDLDGTFRNETQLITKYRELSIQPEIETAIDEIVNEAIVIEDGGQCVEINMDELKVPPAIKKRIEDEFNLILKLLNFNNMGHDIFRRYYVDGRLFYHIVIDETQPDMGIQELKYIDPRRIRKIREIQKMRDPNTGIELIRRQIEYYLYNEKGMIGSGTNLGSKIAPDSIVNVNSGLMDPKQSMVLSYLHKAIKPYNNLRMVEDATVIYRLSRAPERRVFYIDVGNMPTVKAEQYVRDIMVKYRNKLVYDSNTGEIKDDRKHLSMLEDFWLPRREGSKGTEISTLEGARNLGELEDVKYFQSKLYRSLGVPIGRMEPSQGFSLGRTTEISRDEIKFSKFIQRLRNKFSILFDDLLRVQLVSKKVCTDEEWKEFKEDIWYDYKKDNNFDELKESELLMNRLQVLAQIDPFVGKYVPAIWVRKNVLKQTDEEIEEMNAQMEEENTIMAQQQQAQMQSDMEQQQAMQQQDMQNQIEFGAQQQIAQAQVQKQVDKINPDAAKKELAAKDHESKMMDKKIELEKTKNKKPVAGAKKPAPKSTAKKPAKKKTISEEAKDLGLFYAGGNKYMDLNGRVTHLNENGILIPLPKE